RRVREASSFLRGGSVWLYPPQSGTDASRLSTLLRASDGSGASFHQLRHGPRCAPPDGNRADSLAHARSAAAVCLADPPPMGIDPDLRGRQDSPDRPALCVATQASWSSLV